MEFKSKVLLHRPIGVLYKNKDDHIRMRKSGEINLSTFPNGLKDAKGKKLLWGNGKI